MTSVCFISTSSATYGLLTGDPTAKMGGAELQQSLIAGCLRHSGHDVSFLVHDFDQADVVVNDQGIKLVKTFALTRSSLMLRYLKPLRLFAGMDKADADIYYQRAGGPITGLVWAYCRIRRRKFAFAVARDWDVDGIQERSMDPLKRGLYKSAIRGADIVLAQTEYQKRLVEDRFRRPAVLVRNIYRMPEAEESRPAFVLWVANFHSPKRPSMLLEIAERLPEYRFVMVGRPMPGDEHLYDEAVAASKRLPNLEIRGAVPYAEVGHLYSQAQVFVNTSEVEGFPNSFLDALSRRVPVVATFDPDEIICRHNLGFHCGTVDEMVSGLRTVLSDEELRLRLGENGYRYVKSTHDESVIQPRYEEVLVELTGVRPGSQETVLPGSVSCNGDGEAS